MKWWRGFMLSTLVGTTPVAVSDVVNPRSLLARFAWPGPANPGADPFIVRK